MDPYDYVLCQREHAGAREWRSPETFSGDFHEVKRAVLAGYLAGAARWAETPDGFFIFGVDRLGKEHVSGTASPDFS